MVCCLCLFIAIELKKLLVFDYIYTNLVPFQFLPAIDSRLSPFVPRSLLGFSWVTGPYRGWRVAVQPLVRHSTAPATCGCGPGTSSEKVPMISLG